MMISPTDAGNRSLCTRISTEIGEREASERKAQRESTDLRIAARKKTLLTRHQMDRSCFESSGHDDSDVESEIAHRRSCDQRSERKSAVHCHLSHGAERDNCPDRS